MKKIIVLVMMMILVFTTNALADWQDDYSEELSNITDTTVCESNGRISECIELNDDAGHYVWLVGESYYCESAEMTVYRGDELVYEATITNENCDEIYEYVFTSIFEGLL